MYWWVICFSDAFWNLSYFFQGVDSHLHVCYNHSSSFPAWIVHYKKEVFNNEDFLVLSSCSLIQGKEESALPVLAVFWSSSASDKENLWTWPTLLAPRFAGRQALIWWKRRVNETRSTTWIRAKYFLKRLSRLQNLLIQIGKWITLQNVPRSFRYLLIFLH